MKKELFHRGNMVLIAGKIESIKEEEDKIIVQLKDVAGETDEVVFANKTPSTSGFDQRATRFKNASVKEGSFLSILTTKREEGKYNALNFKFSKAMWSFPATAEEKERVVLIGYFIPSSQRENVANFSTSLYKSGISSEWVNVAFWNSGDNTMADKAIEKLTPKDGAKSVFAAVVCGGLPKYYAYRINPDGEKETVKIVPATTGTDDAYTVEMAEKDGYRVNTTYSAISFDV